MARARVITSSRSARLPAASHANRRSTRSSMATEDQHLHLLALCAIKGASWYAIARSAQEPDGLERLLKGEPSEESSEAAATRLAIRSGIGELDTHLARARDEVRMAREQVDARLVTVLDDDYPANLRLIFNLPPFLFVARHASARDAFSVAVVGTREASEEGSGARGRWRASSSRATSRCCRGSRRGSTRQRTKRRSSAPGARSPCSAPASCAATRKRTANSPSGSSERRAGLAVLAEPAAGAAHLPAPQRRDLRHEPGQRSNRGEQDLGREDAGAARTPARQAGVPLRSLVTDQPWARSISRTTRAPSRSPTTPRSCDI